MRRKIRTRKKNRTRKKVNKRRSYKGGNSIMITASNFDDQVLNQDIPTLVNFFAPWCGHCQELKPKWNESSNLLKGRAKLVSVDCTDDKNQSLVKELNIKGFPTIKVFSKG